MGRGQPTGICRGRSASASVWNDYRFHGELRTLSTTVHVQYEDVTNYRYFTSWGGGVEANIMEVVALRYGYYRFTVDDLGSRTNKNQMGKNTFGVGVCVPLNRFSSVPLSVGFDAVAMQQPSAATTFDDWDNFKVYSVTLRWIAGSH